MSPLAPRLGVPVCLKPVGPLFPNTCIRLAAEEMDCLPVHGCLLVQARAGNLTAPVMVSL